MEEKERYEVMYPSLNGYAYIHDFKTDNVLNTYDSCDLLNKQDKENQQLNSIIEKFEEENGYVLFEDGYDENGNEIHKQKYVTYKSKCDELRKENQQLKQQLAENGKEIEKLNACVDFYKSYYISFKEKVIDELEKVKSAFGLINSKLDKVETIKEYIHYIDHQINELKGKK